MQEVFQFQFYPNNNKRRSPDILGWQEKQFNMLVGCKMQCDSWATWWSRITHIYLFFLQDEPEALCFCKETQTACGTDNRTYESVCQMNEASVKGGSALYLKHWGPCHSGKILLNIWCYRSTSYYFLKEQLLL
jgi:hypothetical protein